MIYTGAAPDLHEELAYDKGLKVKDWRIWTTRTELKPCLLLKGTNRLKKDMRDRPWLIQL